MTSRYDAADIEVLSGLDPVKRRPGMYTDTTRPNHLIQEVVDNAVDEALSGYAKTIEVVLHTDGSVEVSDDGQTFHAFPCTATAYPYGSCAGWHPVFANSVTNTIDPTDPAVAGGDDFDLADLGLSEARFIRIVDRVDQTGIAGTFDLDAVSIVHAQCP